MDMNLSAEDLEFQNDVRAFLDENLTDQLRSGMARTPGVFIEPDISLEWHKILHKKGWITPSWPLEYGGTDWTPMQSCLLYTSPSPRDATLSRMPSSA